MVVLFERPRGARGQLWRLEGVNQVHFCEDWGRGDEIQLLLRGENFHLCSIKLSELRLGQVVHDPSAKGVAHHIDGGAHSVPG